MTAGVYRIRNIETGDCYIGCSRQIECRWQDHRSAFKAGRHKNPLLAQAYAEFGEEAFVYEVLQTCKYTPTKLELMNLERQWIAKLNPAYNVDPSFEQQKQRASEFMKWHWREHRRKRKDDRLHCLPTPRSASPKGDIV